MSRTILVTGATGQQGSAVVSALSALPSSPFNILALTRDPTSSRAKALVSSHPDVQIIAGNLDDPEAIFASHGKPIWGVFSVQIFLGGGASIASEERQGRALVDAALANDVKYFVYTSGDRHGKDSEHDDTPVPHLASKARLERYLKAKVDEGHGQMQYTILRPVFFMENIADDFVGKTTLTAWKLRVGANKLQVVSTIDVGVFAAKAFANPEKYSGKAISLAGDELSFEEANNIWRGQKGKCLPTTLGVLAAGVLIIMPDLNKMFDWFKDVGFGADIDALRVEHPELMTFKTWAQRNNGQRV